MKLNTTVPALLKEITDQLQIISESIVKLSEDIKIEIANRKEHNKQVMNSINKEYLALKLEQELLKRRSTQNFQKPQKNEVKH